MLTKMGYTPDTGLGASNGQGTKEPIALTMRPARSGLGVAEAQRSTLAEAQALQARQGARTCSHGGVVGYNFNVYISGATCTTPRGGTRRVCSVKSCRL